MKRNMKSGLASKLIIGATIALCGCHSEGTNATTGNESSLTKDNLGKYPPAPGGYHPRVGVEPFQVNGVQGLQIAQLDDIAADETTNLLVGWGGFKMIERAQLEQLFKEQNLPGIQPGEAAAAQHIHGVDLILIGKITNLSFKREHTTSGGNYGVFSNEQRETKITTSCGVLLRLENPTTGDIVASSQSNYQKVDTSTSGGTNVMGVRNNSSSDIELSDEDKGELLQMALDDAIRKAIPQFEKAATDFHPPAAPAGSPQ